MNKNLLKHIYQVAEPFIWFLFGIIIFRLFVGAGSLESVLYSLLVIGVLAIIESVASLVCGAIKSIRVLWTMKKMQVELSKMANKEVKGE